MSRLNAGFTIIELTVVMVILGGIVALAIPNLTRLYDAVIYKTTLDSILSMTRSASVYAYSSGRAIQLQSYVQDQEGFPDDWSVKTDTEITVSADGICRGGVLHIVSPRQVYTYKLQPPFCDISN